MFPSILMSELEVLSYHCDITGSNEGVRQISSGGGANLLSLTAVGNGVIQPEHFCDLANIKFVVFIFVRVLGDYFSHFF